jgi:hypothetical protein
MSFSVIIVYSNRTRDEPASKLESPLLKHCHFFHCQVLYNIRNKLLHNIVALYYVVKHYNLILLSVFWYLLPDFPLSFPPRTFPNL